MRWTPRILLAGALLALPLAAQADASSADPALGPWKWNFNAGAGPTAVTGSQGNLKGGTNFTVGGGYNFNSRTGLDLEYMDEGLGVTNSAVQENQSTNGRADVWSVTLNPVWRYKIGGIVGGYLIGGGGFYQRRVRYDDIQQAELPLVNGGTALIPVRVGDTIQNDDAGGVNVGMGFTFNIDGGTKLYVEVRYHYILTPGYATQLIPVTFGFRF